MGANFHSCLSNWPIEIFIGLIMHYMEIAQGKWNRTAWVKLLCYCYWKVSEEVVYLRKRTNKDVIVLLTSDSTGNHGITHPNKSYLVEPMGLFCRHMVAQMLISSSINLRQNFLTSNTLVFISYSISSDLFQFIVYVVSLHIFLQSELLL